MRYRGKGFNAFLALVFALVVIPALVQAQFYQEPLKWEGTESCLIVKNYVDTSDVFYIPKDYVAAARYGKDYPAQLGWQWNTLEENDSTYVTFKYQLSLDGENWLTAVLFDTVKTEDANQIKIINSWNLALYGRIIATGVMATGDTVTLSGTFAKKY